jgi:hypothetical protein
MTMPTPGTALDVDITGDFAQNIIGTPVNGNIVQSMTTFVRGRPSMYLGPAEIADLMACYVPARNHDLIVKELEVSNAVLLTGPRGCGRQTTAIAAIRQLRPGIPIRRFSLEDEDAEEIDAKGSGVYLIHAADGGLTRLGRCTEAVRAAGGYLAVIGDQATQRHPAAALLSWMAVEPPCPVQVYQRRVIACGFTAWPHWDEASILLQHALPADARRLADLVEQVAPQAGDIMAGRAEVAHAYRGWKDELRSWFDEHREPHDRALLVAAAALSPATDDEYIYAAASSLTQRLQVTINGGGLAWCPVTGLPAMLMAEQEDSRIIFRRHGFARSALYHALADYPLARPDLLTWLAALPTDDAIRPGLRNSLAASFADLAAEHGSAGLITETAHKWGEDNLADLAFIALSRTCLHPRAGGKVRTALYDWSRAARTPQTLKLAIARACEPLGQTYPLLALTRLKHLATHGNRQVLSEVIQAALALATSGHHAEVLAAALAWCAQANRENLSYQARQRRRRAGATLFLELAAPVTASGLPKVLDGTLAVDPLTCAPGWRAALDFHTGAFNAGANAFEEALRRWLDAALRHARLREEIARALVEAATPPDTVPGSVRETGPAEPGLTTAQIMIGMVRRWATTDPPDPIRRKIREHIVIPLTQPSWLRLLKVLYIKLRTLVDTARTP